MPGKKPKKSLKLLQVFKVTHSQQNHQIIAWSEAHCRSVIDRGMEDREKN